jgi:ATP-binding cassette subfamily D (ALD) protein 3
LNHSEEIAFYNGSDWEKKRINEKFGDLLNHLKHVLYKRFMMGIVDSMLVKYGATMVGYSVVGLPVFGPNREAYLASVANDPSRITNDYVRNSSLLINLAKAIGRIVVSYKDVQNLAGYTTLIYEMDEVLKDLKAGKFVRTQVTAAATQDGGENKTQSKTLNMHQGSDRVIRSENIGFEEVPIISPNGDVLIEKMTFEVKPGMHLMISGPNRCGKSSLFRIMGNLWPVTGGKLHKPDQSDIFYIPQRPYLP